MFDPDSVPQASTLMPARQDRAAVRQDGRVRAWQRFTGLSTRRRAVLVAAAVAVLVPLVAIGVSQLVKGTPTVPAQDRPGPVILVPGYGGGTGGVDALAAHIRAAGREAIVASLPGDGTGDLNRQADALDATVTTALKAGAPSVDVIGYSAGGVVARLWVQDHDGLHKARRVITIGSPHHGASIAAAGAAGVPGACPAACLQLVPGSRLLGSLTTPVATPPAWLALWTEQDQTVTPPDSGRLEGAVSLSLQSICPQVRVDHSGLPSNPLVVKLVLDAISAAPLRIPDRSDCVSS
jgi:triacylglycerol lipase